MRTIVWDVDDVLNDLMRRWLEDEWRVRHPHCRLSYADIHQNPPQALLGVDRQEYAASLDEFRLSGRYAKMLPLPAVQQWFMAHGAGFRHVALTAVPLKAAGVSADWVMTHFGAWIRTFHVVPSVRAGDSSTSYDRSKIDFLEWFGKVDIFVDDTSSNLEGCEKTGIRGVLFPRPWNDSTACVPAVLTGLSGSLAVDEGRG